MTLNSYSPKSRRLVFILFVLISLGFSGTAFGKKKSSSGRSARASKNRKASARSRTTSRRGGRHVVRSSRRGRGGRVTARDLRRQRQLVAREQSNAIRAMERKLRRPLTRRVRAAAVRCSKLADVQKLLVVLQLRDRWHWIRPCAMKCSHTSPRTMLAERM